MILIIAEKPSLARNIADAVGGMRRQQGFLEGKNYLITWAFGHLFSLCDIEDYTGPTSAGRWSLENLPCFPEKFRFTLKKDASGKVDEGVRRQFDVIASLCNREDVDTIVNAGDADREGEIIIRLCVENALKTPKNFLRLWLPDQTPETVRAALGEMKSEDDYQNLAFEGFARTYIDWLYGVNLTRFATLKTGTLLRVGRVIVPIVKAIYDRDKAIEAFTPEIYYGVTSKAETNGVIVEMNSKEKFSKDEKEKAENWAKTLNGEKAVVVAKKEKKDKLLPGKLYSLSKLQNALGKKYKMPMEESLKLLQGLYEKGYVTYPRTNSEYLASAEKEKVKKILEGVKKLGYPVAFCDRKTIFDDSKIESHSALTPTYKIPKKEELSEREMLVYQTVFRRFAAVFCAEECLCRKTEMTVKAGDKEEFTLKGTVILQKGWMKFDDGGKNDKLLPDLKKGDEVNTAFAVKEKETAPPKHYTIETLNNYLKNPFKEEKARAAEKEDEFDDADEYRAMFEGLELGTEATRTGIIDNAVKSRYIDLKKDVYTLLPGGAFLIEQLLLMGISMDKYKTSTLGRALKQVYHGKIAVDDAVKMAREEISAVFERRPAPPETDTDTGFYGDKVGVCPLCGKEVLRGKFSYGCSGYKEGCKFKINLEICRRAVSLQNAKTLLRDGKTGVIQGFLSKKNTLFDAALKLEDGKAVFDFPPKKPAAALDLPGLEGLIPPS